MRATLESCKYALQQASGRCLADPVLLDYLNQAMQRLLPEGDWVGTVARYNFCAVQSCITLPAEVQTMQGYFIPDAPDGRPGHVRDDWYEMVDNGPGVLSDTSAYSNTLDTAVDAGQASTFFDICGSEKKVKVYCDVAEAAGAYITVKGLDDNGNWIRTFVSGSWIDGEQILLDNATPQTSVNFFSSIRAVDKPVTNGAVRLYQYNVDTTQNLIAVYEYRETLPCYRRYKIPGLLVKAGEEGSPILIKALCKRAYLPILNDTDELIIANIGALKNAIRCIIMEDDQMPDKAAYYWKTAIDLLTAERLNYRGKNPGNEPIRHFENSSRRLTLGVYKSMIYRIQKDVIARDDLMVANRVNESVQRLLNEGDWLGTIVRYNLVCAQSTITLPAFLETLIGYNTNWCNWSFFTVPGHVRGNWYEYQDNGPGLVTEARSYRINPQQMVPRDDTPTYLNVDPTAGETGMKLKVYADVPEDANAYMLVKGIDGQGNFIRTEISVGNWIDGERIPINNTTPQISAHYFSQVLSVSKPLTNGVIRLYQYNTSPVVVQSEIGFYQAWEMEPWYRRYFLPGIDSHVQAGGQPITLHIIAKVRFKPVRADTDAIQITNFSALKQMLKCIEKEEEGTPQAIQASQMYMQNAIHILNREIVNNNGKGTKATLNIQVRGFAGSEIPNLI